jgi:hypothetical protein
MELFKNIRLNTGKSILRKKLARMKRTKFKGNISTARTIGIVWDAINPDDFTILSQLHQKMHQKNIEVKIIGYFPGKNLPDRCTAIRYLTCLKKQDINFFYRPVSTEANSFISTKFDILIDINFQKLFPLVYISTISAAGFKVGLYDAENENTIYDLMIELKKSTDINTYLNQILYYLEMINTGTNKKDA